MPNNTELRTAIQNKLQAFASTPLRDASHEKTTPGLLRQLRDANILRVLQPSSGRRSSVLCFPRLINLAEGEDVL